MRRGAALVTGAGRRIGRTLALGLAERGFDVAVHYGRSRDEAEAVVAEIRALGREAAAVPGDLQAPDVEPIVEAAARALGPLHVLVNNASRFQPDEIGALTSEGWSAHLDSNLRAPVFLAQAFARQAPSGAAIVNVLDQRVLRPGADFFSYGVSKAGLWWATRTLALALAPHVRVNGVGPGPTLPSVHQTEADFAAEAASTPLRRRAAPEEIRDAVLFLIDAPSVTGQMIAVDGGQHLAPA